RFCCTYQDLRRPSACDPRHAKRNLPPRIKFSQTNPAPRSERPGARETRKRSVEELQVMKRRIGASSLVVTALLAAGCGGGNGPAIGPTNTARGNGNPGGATPPPANPATTALFQPLQGVLPYPTDLYFSGSTDGTLNIQPANALMPLQSGVNALD